MAGEIGTKLKAVLARTIGRWSAGDSTKRVAVLCYHSLSPLIPSSTSAALFESHLGWLAVFCEILSFENCQRAPLASVSKPKVVITFDDGYLDNYKVVLPLLLKYGLTATFFLTSGFIDNTLEANVQLASGWQVSPSVLEAMTWRQVGELASVGMSIGAHTELHPVLGRMDESSVYEELKRSRNRLEDALQQPITSMSYPYGRPGSAVTRATLRAAKRVGFSSAGTVLTRGVRSTDEPLAIPRFIVDGDSLETLQQKVFGWWDWIGTSREVILRERC